MGSLLQRSLIFIGIMAAGLAFYAVRFNLIAAGYQQLAKPGNLSKLEKPQYQSDTADHTDALGDIRVISYTIPADFATGPAIFKINLASTGEAIYIHQFGIHSEVFAEAQ